MGVPDVTVENLQPCTAYELHGAITVTRQVLPDMLERSNGTFLYHDRRIAETSGPRDG